MTAVMGDTDSDFTDGPQRIDEIDVQEGSNLLALNMPVDPNGVIYDSMTRGPVTGATVTLLDARNSVPLPSSCFDDPNQQGQVTVRQRLLQVRPQLLRPGLLRAVRHRFLLQVATAPGAGVRGRRVAS